MLLFPLQVEEERREGGREEGRKGNDSRVCQQLFVKWMTALQIRNYPERVSSVAFPFAFIFLFFAFVVVVVSSSLVVISISVAASASAIAQHAPLLPLQAQPYSPPSPPLSLSVSPMMNS